MTDPASRLTCALLAGVLAALPCHAESFASSASSAGSASVGSVSDSLRDSSGSSKTDKVAEGDYRIVVVTAAERPDTLRLKMQPVAHADDDAAVVYLDLPRAALDRGAMVDDVIGVRQRPYGYEFAWADTRVAFFLVLADDWRRELDPRPVQP